MLYGGSLLWQAESIFDHCHTKQKSHRFCISASTMASYWSGRRGSNSLPPPWQGGALPDELRPHIGKPEWVSFAGASDRNRTNDTGIFSPLLYRLSYRGVFYSACLVYYILSEMSTTFFKNFCIFCKQEKTVTEVQSATVSLSSSVLRWICPHNKSAALSFSCGSSHTV